MRITEDLLLLYLAYRLGLFISKIIAYLLMTDLYRYLPQFFRVETSLSHFDLKYDLSSLKVFYYIIAYYVTL